MPQEGLEQFRVYVNPYDAEFTRAGSYVISAKAVVAPTSGRAQAFGFYQNKDVIARNAFQRVVPNFGRQQLGFNISGPLKKDKLFIATSYELTSTNFYLDVNPTSGANWASFKGSFLAPNKNHTLFTRLTYVQSPQVTYDAMVSARFLRGEGNFGARVSQDGGISQKYEIYTGQLRQKYVAKSGNFVNEGSLQVVSWNHTRSATQAGARSSTTPGSCLARLGFR